MRDATNSKRTAIAVEGFGVPHVHVHLVPVNKVNDLDPHLAHSETSEKLLAMAKKVRAALSP